MFAIIVSFMDIALISGCCHAARTIARKSTDGIKRILAEEFISTLEFCSVCFELAFVCDNYGKTVFAIALYIMCLWWGSHWGDAAVNPNKYLEDIVRGDSEPKDAGYKIGIETASGIIVWSLVRRLWAMGYSELHLARSQEITCNADLQTTVIKGAAVELIITFIDRINALSQEHYEWQYSNVFNSILSTGLVLAALDYSGGYFNPVLALSLKFGCRGHSIPEHIIVYWIASIAGSLLALQVYKAVVNSLGLKKLGESEDAVADGKKQD